MTAPRLTLVSHALCPYVQRAAIVLAEKGAMFERRDVDLANKPDWFVAISPLGKTPVLLVEAAPIFESAVICEYLDETIAPRLHPADPLRRAQHRAWIEFASALLDDIAGFYNAPDAGALAGRRDRLAARLARVEAALSEVPFFAGAAFGLVDAAFAPVFRYFDVIDPLRNFDIFDGLPRVQRWRRALAQRPSVIGAAAADYPQRLRAFLADRRSALSHSLFS